MNSEHLSIPRVPSVRYQRNFIQGCVCELRFPSILELENKPPEGLQKRLRKKYPLYEQKDAVDIGPPGDVKRHPTYVFRTKDRKWAISLRSSSISLETTAYTDFNEFTNRLLTILKESSSLLDTDFFTRVGLRYINRVPVKDGKLKGWINDSLVLPLTSGIFGNRNNHISQAQGSTEFGAYQFRHWLESQEGKTLGYYLDYDYSAENVLVKDTIQLLSDFSQLNFSFFSWSLGQKALDWLGVGAPKDKDK